jgi:hypothetical protein
LSSGIASDRRSRLFGAAIPCNQDVLAHALRWRPGRDHDGKAGFEQAGALRAFSIGFAAPPDAGNGFMNRPAQQFW